MEVLYKFYDLIISLVCPSVIDALWKMYFLYTFQYLTEEYEQVRA